MPTATSRLATRPTATPMPTATATTSPTSTASSGACVVTYRVNPLGNVFIGNLTVADNGPALIG
jgi:hypothetical protein